MMKIRFHFHKLSLRLKLTLWFTLSFMAILAFSFLSFYLVTKNLMLSKIDDSLLAQSSEVVTLLKTQSLSPASKELILKTFQITKTNLVMVLNKDGEIVAQSLTFPIDADLLAKLTSDFSENPTEHFVSFEKLRFHLSPLYNGDQLLGLVIVGDSLSTINDSFTVLFNTLLLVFFLFLLPLLLISFLEAEISLSPLRELARKMNAINPNNLSDRVDIVNPQDEIGEVSLAFNGLLERLQKGFIKERQLIHDVSHQLKTPLTALRSDIEIALTKNRAVSVYRNILHDLLHDASRMDSLLKDMMNFAWASSEEQGANFTPQNLSQLLTEVAEITQQVGMEKNIKVQTSIDPDINILGQKEKLFQIFINILENAVKYSHENGQIIIQAVIEKQYARIIVKDNGMGISKKDLPKIFDRFYRADTSSEGSGLGLSITAALIKAHKGTIEAASVKGKGTTFLITLPLAKRHISKAPAKKVQVKKILPILLKRSNVQPSVQPLK